MSTLPNSPIRRRQGAAPRAGIVLVFFLASAVTAQVPTGLPATPTGAKNGSATARGAVSPLRLPPPRTVVLTFDDSSKSHFTIVRPLLLQYGFSATFFITEGFDFPTNKKDYMTWAEIAQLHRDGFEIGNHTRDHLSITDANAPACGNNLTRSLIAVANMACPRRQVSPGRETALP